MSQNEVQSIFKAVSESLVKKPWFKKGKWKVSTHTFPPKKPSFVTFHVFKDQWFNNEREGIHIESFLAFDPKSRKKSSVTIHLLHYDLVPGTKIKRREISQPIVDAIFEEVSSWDGYKFRAGKYGLQPFTKTLDGSSANFTAALVEEISRICQVIGPVVDTVLAQKV
jgi:hypothetical protein